MKILHVVGARPNFMKAAPVIDAMGGDANVSAQILVHTGQHYDRRMSEIFFEELGLPEPDVNLDVGSGSHAWQTATIMQRFEPLLDERKPDWVLVYGDVNSTLACSLVCVKRGVPAAHVEAGLRSYDRTMPEEFNRLLVDQMADLLLTPSADAESNLLREGIPRERIRFVGNVMIDTLKRLLPLAQERAEKLCRRLGVDRFVLVTLHRPSNVDCPETLAEIIEALADVSHEIPVVFPVHPRTRNRLQQTAAHQAAGLLLHEPFGYLDFLALQTRAALVVTDSGGVQEETTYLGIDCLTVRPNTERPITVECGTNELVSSTKEALRAAIQRRLIGSAVKHRVVPEKWDGQAGFRIAQEVARFTPSQRARYDHVQATRIS